MRSILIVDDDEFILFGLCRAIAGHPETKNDRLLTARHGEQAMQLLRSSRIDLMVTDLRMPIMNGYALVEQVNRQYPGMPVFVMTGDYLDDVTPKFKTAKVSRFVSKPFSFRQLADDIAAELAIVRPAAVVRPAASC